MSHGALYLQIRIQTYNYPFVYNFSKHIQQTNCFYMLKNTNNSTVWYFHPKYVNTEGISSSLNFDPVTLDWPAPCGRAGDVGQGRAGASRDSQSCAPGDPLGSPHSSTTSLQSHICKLQHHFIREESISV